jgi:hypothetical protein
MYILLAALVVVGVLWFVLKPAWAPKPPDTSKWTGKASQASRQATAKAGEISKDATAKAGQVYQGLRGRLKFRSDTRELAKQFKQWVSEAAPAKRVELYNTLPASAEGFAIWLGSLSDKDLERFTQGVARFCATLNFDIAWLTDPQVSREPELKKAVEDAVLLYSLTTWRANNVQQDVKGFFAYQAWLGNPKRHSAFGQQLLGALIQRGAVTVTPELYLAPEKERVTHATTAIRKVADEDHAAFLAALRQVVGGGETAPAAPVAEVPPAPEPAAAAAAEAPQTEPAEVEAAQPARRKLATAGGAA